MLGAAALTTVTRQPARKKKPKRGSQMTQNEDRGALRQSRRADTLKQCMQAEAEWTRQPGRNLVLFFDGTGNLLGTDEDTNVVKMLRLLKKRMPYKAAVEQIAFYDPGVGTNNNFPPAGVAARSRNKWQLLQGLALGQGAFENVAEGYEFLCREYQPGDRIWLFGFSRGAFTARAVGGMVNMYGLVYPSGLSIVRTLVRTYFADSTTDRSNFAADVMEQFSLGRAPLIHFTGVWDTVETIGLTGGVAITNSSELEHKRFVHVRHALSLHETRDKYRPREYTPPTFTKEEETFRSFKQRWFRGVHSDIGGSYAEDGLSNITLKWMVEEAEACGLEFASHQEVVGEPKQPMHDQVLDSPYWLLTGLNTRERKTVEAPIDRSALPVAAATPAKRTTKKFVTTHAGVLLFLAAAVLYLVTSYFGKAACDVGKSPEWVASIPFAFQLLAPFRGELNIACTDAGINNAMFSDTVFLFAYWAWLPYPLAWSLRRLCARAIDVGRALPFATRKVHLALWLVLGSDFFENVFTLILATSSSWLAWVVAFLFVAKLAGLLWVLAVFAAGAIVRRGTGIGPVQPA